MIFTDTAGGEKRKQGFDFKKFQSLIMRRIFMKLELLKVSIKGVKWGGSTEVLKDGTLQVSKEDLLAFVADDDNLKSINADIALPEKV